MSETKIELPKSENHLGRKHQVIRFVWGIVWSAVLGFETSLTYENGLFYPSNDVRKKAILFKLKIQEIVEESLALIEKVRVLA